MAPKIQRGATSVRRNRKTRPLPGAPPRITELRIAQTTRNTRLWRACGKCVNRSPVATGRKSWLFVGSDDHAEAAANLYSIIASCKLHGIDPERYLAE